MKNQIGLVVCSTLLLFTVGCNSSDGGGGSSSSVNGAVDSFNTAAEGAAEAECECQAEELGYSSTEACVSDRYEPQNLSQCEERAASCDRRTYVSQMDCLTDAARDYKNCLAACGGTATQSDAGGDAGDPAAGDQDDGALFQSCQSEYTNAVTACTEESSETLETAFAECRRGEVPACFFGGDNNANNTNNNTPDGGTDPDGGGTDPDGGGTDPDGGGTDPDGGTDVGFTDTDNDGFPDDVDNCPFAPNPSQTDSDGDGDGDACDDDGGGTDRDNDGVNDAEDNCPDVPNPSQDDRDSNETGDACDDFDGDNIVDADDNCPEAYNPNQTDSNGNGVGDECDDSGGDPNDPRIDSATNNFNTATDELTDTSCGCYYDSYDPPYSSSTECYNDVSSDLSWGTCERNAIANDVDSFVSWMSCYTTVHSDFESCITGCVDDATYSNCRSTFESGVQSCDSQLADTVIQGLNACAN